MLREQTLPARTAKQLKKAKHIWANQRRREAMSGTLPSLTGLKLTRKTELDYTLYQEFVPLSDSDVDSESEGTCDQGLISIPVPEERLASLRSANNFDAASASSANVVRDENWN